MSNQEMRTFETGARRSIEEGEENMDINKYHNESKKQSIKNQIVERVDELIEVLDKANSLDYFTIEIKSHEGSLNVDCTLKSRKKVY